MDDKQTKAGALLLWGLMGTADDDLAKFRRQRLGRKSEVDLEHLKRVRAMLRGLVHAIRNDDEGRWEGVRKAAALVPDPAAAAPIVEDEPAASPEGEAATGDDEAERVEGRPGSQHGTAGAPKPGRPVLPPVIAPVAPPAKPSPWAPAAEPGDEEGETTAETNHDETALLPIEEMLAAQRGRRQAAGLSDATLDPDGLEDGSLPFAPAAQADEARDPHDPEAETVKLRAHVMPFKRRAPATEPPPAAGAAPAEGAKPARRKVSEQEAAELPVTEGLQRYAEFCAALAAAPAKAPEIREAFGVVGDEAQEDLDLTWNERFADDPRLLERWEQLFEKTLARLREGD